MKRKNVGFGVALGILALVASVWLIVGAYRNRDGRCVRIKPGEVVAGRIALRGGGMFSRPSVAIPTLYYLGRYAVSGKECRTCIFVTEAEYSRVMYGKERVGDE